MTRPSPSPLKPSTLYQAFSWEPKFHENRQFHNTLTVRDLPRVFMGSTTTSTGRNSEPRTGPPGRYRPLLDDPPGAGGCLLRQRSLVEASRKGTRRYAKGRI